MFTDESIYLRNEIIKKVNIKNTNELKLLYKHLKKIKIIPLNQTYYSQNFKKTQKIKSYYMSDQIIEKISDLKNFTRIKYQNKKINLILNLYAQENIDHFVDNIIPIIEFVCSLSTFTTKNLTINYYLLDEKKLFEDNEFLTKDEVNSGSCSRNNKYDSEITIWRKEEIAKVTIHELFHALHYDFHSDNHTIIQYYQKKYKITSNSINTYEAYTELWANLINCFLLSEKIKRNKYNAFLIMIYLEKEFCSFQSQKIINKYNISINQYDINKHTNILAYFLIRCELYEKLTQFLKYCRLNNTKYVNFKNKKEWYKLLQNNKKLIIINKSSHNKKLNNFYNQTIRMSLNEIKLF